MRKFLLVLACGLAVAGCSSDSSTSGDAAGTGSGMGRPGAYGSQGMQGLGANGALTDAERARLTREMIAAAGSDRVYFGTDKVDLDGTGRATMTRIAGWMKQNPTVSFLLEGHADERGTREYNLALGERRAESLRSFLLAEGISSGRLRTVTYGKERPDVNGHGESSWSRNRRGVVVVQ